MKKFGEKRDQSENSKEKSSRPLEQKRWGKKTEGAKEESPQTKRKYQSEKVDRSGGKEGSWEQVSGWYKKNVGEKGHYYHKRIVIPGVLRMLNLKGGDSLLDLACGQGVLARAIPNQIDYEGVDISPSLIQEAKIQTPGRSFRVGDATKTLGFLGKKRFTHAAIVLALQNISDPVKAFENLAERLVPGGKAVLVLNHPCFRIPKESHWYILPEEDIQARRIDRYQSDMKIEIQSEPSKGDKSPISYSYHFSLEKLFAWAFETGFVVDGFEEWVSDKKSYGAAANRENRARKEIPMFLAVRIRRVNE